MSGDFTRVLWRIKESSETIWKLLDELKIDDVELRLMRPEYDVLKMNEVYLADFGMKPDRLLPEWCKECGEPVAECVCDDEEDDDE